MHHTPGVYNDRPVSECCSPHLTRLMLRPTEAHITVAPRARDLMPFLRRSVDLSAGSTPPGPAACSLRGAEHLGCRFEPADRASFKLDRSEHHVTGSMLFGTCAPPDGLAPAQGLQAPEGCGGTSAKIKPFTAERRAILDIIRGGP